MDRKALVASMAMGGGDGAVELGASVAGTIGARGDSRILADVSRL